MPFCVEVLEFKIHLESQSLAGSLLGALLFFMAASFFITRFSLFLSCSFFSFNFYPCVCLFWARFSRPMCFCKCSITAVPLLWHIYTIYMSRANCFSLSLSHHPFLFVRECECVCVGYSLFISSSPLIFFFVVSFRRTSNIFCTYFVFLSVMIFFSPCVLLCLRVYTHIFGVVAAVVIFIFVSTHRP